MRVSCQATNPGGRQRLILPGDAQFNQGPGQQSSRLIIPGQGNSRQGGSSSLSMNQTRDFRPPPGFMDLDSPDAATKPDPSDGPSLPAEVMLERLSRESDAWTTLARFLGQLVPLGYDSATVEEVAGVERRRQHLWLTALQVGCSRRHQLAEGWRWVQASATAVWGWSSKGTQVPAMQRDYRPVSTPFPTISLFTGVHLARQGHEEVGSGGVRGPWGRRDPGRAQVPDP